MESLGHSAASTEERLQSASSSSTHDSGGGSLQRRDPLSAFEMACITNGERFPLMAARLAFMRLTRVVKRARLQWIEQQQHQQQRPSSSETSIQAASPAGHSRGVPQQNDEPAIFEGDPVTDLGLLCFANVEAPYPDHWVQLHAALRLALEAAVVAAEQQLGMKIGEASGRDDNAGVGSIDHRIQHPLDTVARELRSELASLDLDWFVSVLSRLHINVFRVGCMLPPSSALFRPDKGGAADGSRLAWPDVGASTSGSAAYLMASLFNHSCEPNLEVVFRRNDSTAMFVASRDIDKAGPPSRLGRHPPIDFVQLIGFGSSLWDRQVSPSHNLLA